VIFFGSRVGDGAGAGLEARRLDRYPLPYL